MGKDFITLLLVTVVTIFCWIAFDVYHARTTRYVPKDIEQLAAPLTPTLDASFVQELTKREL